MKKKAFTLIELLAVIIILAIIALIATPIVLDVINDARKSASKSAAALVLNSAKLYYAEQYIKPNGSFEGYECTISNKSGCDELSIDGDKPDSAIITINKEGRISGKVVFGEYTYYYCKNTLSETENAACPLTDYTLVYEIDVNGMIIGIKDVSYITNKEITIPEYVGEIEVKGIASNAFSNYDIDVITILPIIELEIGTDAFPIDLVTLKVKKCVEDYYYDYRNILELIESTCVIERYKDIVLNGADPKLDEGMIPVVIDSDGSLTKASMIKQWYNYTDKQWANIVLVSEESREGYLNAKAGSPINTTDVLAYFVWVPRYKYQIFTDVNNILVNQDYNTNTARQINIVFENNETTKSTGTTKDSWLTHPAFTFGTDELNGLWVGKFETTGNATKPTILPNETSLREQNISTQFITSLKFANNTLNSDGSITHTNNTTYGINNTDSHMMKNSEWGAVAYLTNSIYGRCTESSDGSYTCEEVRINNSETYTTGCAATTAATTKTYTEYLTQTNGSEGSYNGCENAYNTTRGVLASTTGNITGIYDMSGGAWEYVMGVMETALNSGIPVYSSSDSGFTGVKFPTSQYYDLYAYGTSDVDAAAYNRGHLGDSTYELGSFASNLIDGATRHHSTWNKDLAYFVNHEYPWFLRGGRWLIGSDAGVFAFDNHNGHARSHVSFRTVLAK